MIWIVLSVIFLGLVVLLVWFWLPNWIRQSALFNRCAVCDGEYPPEILRNMGKYIMCVFCLEQEQETLKEKGKVKTRIKTRVKDKKEEVEEPQDEAEIFSQNLGEGTDVAFND